MCLRPSECRADHGLPEWPQMTLIIAGEGDRLTLAAKAATTRFAIVFTGTDDPVGFRLVTSLNQAGGNVNGDLRARSEEVCAAARVCVHEGIDVTFACARAVHGSSLFFTGRRIQSLQLMARQALPTR